MSNFKTFWQTNFGLIPPLGYKLRLKFSDRWIRFHSLPQSKRYADSKEEMNTILTRGNILGTESLGLEEDCWVVLASYDQESVDKSIQKEFPLLERAFSWIDLSEDFDDRVEISFDVFPIKWMPNSVDKLFTRIANDEITGLIVNKFSKRIIAPYDGGFDLILEDEFAVERYKSNYKDWMSDRKDWL